jgi:hypothetical protein
MIHIVLGVVFKSSSCQIFISHSSSIVTSSCDVLPPKSFNTKATEGPHVVMIWKHNLDHNDLGPFIFETFHHPWLIARPFYHQPCDLKFLIFFTSCIVSSCNSFFILFTMLQVAHWHSMMLVHRFLDQQSNFTHLMSCGVESYSTWVCHFEAVARPHVSLTHRQTLSKA